MNQKKVVASAPGRICLFGEHQDYLGLPVIAMAVDRRFQIEFQTANQSNFLIHTPDLKNSGPQPLNIYASRPRHAEDFCWGIAQVLLEEGFHFPKGGEAIFTSTIPVRAGCSSSSAMSAAWMRLLLEIGEHPDKDSYINNPVRIANLVYKGEKEKFQGSGGMMDQYSCYLGGLIHVYESDYYETNSSQHDTYSVENLLIIPDDIILIDSGQPKDTQGILSRVSSVSSAAVQKIQIAWPEFHLRDTTVAEFQIYLKTHSPRDNLQKSGAMVLQQLYNRDLCQEALGYFRSKIKNERIAEMLNQQHFILSRTLGISTPRIEEIRELVIANGAMGAKINGSGGGGTLFCFAPGKVEKVSDVLSQASIVHYKVCVDQGARIEN